MSSYELSAAYLERKLRAATGIQGSNPLPQLPDIRGFLQLEVDRPEWSFAANELFWWLGFHQVPVVAQFSYGALENPASSGVIAVLEKYKQTPTEAGGASNAVFMFIDATDVPLAGQVNNIQGQPRDLRLRNANISNQGSVCRVINGANASPSATATNTSVVIAGATGGAGNNTDSFDQSVIISPGKRVIVQGVLQNIRVDGAFIWRERPLEGNIEIR